MKLAIYSPAPCAGKTTLANMIINKRSNSVVMSFATPLKEMVNSLLSSCSISPDYATYKDDMIPDFGMSYRDLCISIGSRWGREVMQDIWVKTMKCRLKQLDKSKNILIDDMRCENEYLFLKNLGFKFLFVDRGVKSNLRCEGLLSPKLANYTIKNDGDLYTLEKQLDKIMAKLSK